MHLAFAILATPLIALAAVLGMSRSTSANKPAETRKEEIRVVPVAPTAESNTIMLAIVIPKENERLSSNPIWVQFRIDGFALGSDSSQFERADEIARTNMGQTIHVVVDNEPYFSVNEPALNQFNESGYYYNQSFKFEMPFSLKEGVHTIRMFPARSFGESLKGENTFRTSTFYVGNSDSGDQINFSKPFLTYNEPSDGMNLTDSQPILLDFLIANCELSTDGYKVRLTIDGKTNRMLTSWQPYYIYGLKKGKHKIRLELLNGNSKVSGPFSEADQTITVL